MVYGCKHGQSVAYELLNQTLISIQALAVKTTYRGLILGNGLNLTTGLILENGLNLTKGLILGNP